jgi:2-polyprenyl-6-methoxyphenol hydroxylase-like FAD-dependent oxidoreductase
VLDSDGKEVARHEDRTFSGGRFDSGDIELLRDDLADLLLTASAPAESIFDDTITSLEQDDAQVAVTFQHHPPRRFDLVVGADGLHSNVRQLMLADEKACLVPLGVGLAIYTTPNLLDLRDWELGFRGATSGYVIYPARDNTELRVNLGFGMDLDEYPRGDIAAQKAIVRARCAHLGGDIPRLLAALADTSSFYFGPLAQVRMDEWSKGRVTLVGDAAHCPSPFSGQGTSLALVGAFVLGRELARSDDHAEAFARYEARMRPFVLLNQDMVSVERQGPIPDDVFDRAKNGINLDDLLTP